MKKTFKWAVFICSISLIYIAGCKQNPYLSSDLQASNSPLWLSAPDTFTVVSYQEREDSVQTSNLELYQLGGINNDFQFGSTQASLYMQLNLPADQFSFGENPIIDSAFIMLAYNSIYGDTNSLQDITVRQINTNGSMLIKPDVTYYSYQNFDFVPTVIGSKSNFKFDMNLVTKEYKDTLPAVLKIPIYDMAFLNSLKNQSSSGNFLNNTAFHNYINGLYLKSSSISNAIMSIKTSSVITSMVVYYKNSNQGDSILARFPLNRSGSVNHFDNNLQNATANNYQNLASDSVIYLCGNGNTRGAIQFPYLGNLPKNILINQAVLTITTADSNVNNQLSVPTALYLAKKGDARLLERIEDDLYGSPFTTINNTKYFGGERTNNGQYSFNIAQYLQEQLLGNYIGNENLYILVKNSSNTPNRVIIGGGSHSKNKIKLKLLYTILK
jgi:hypothetical protein